jgi:cytoskeletal protein RodZ
MAIVLVGGSALLLAGAMAALAFGFVNEEDSLVWTALIASGIAAVFLVFAYFLSKRELKRAGARPSSEPDPATAPEREKEEGKHPSHAVTSTDGEAKEPTADPTRSKETTGDGIQEVPPGGGHDDPVGAKEPSAPAAVSSGSPTAPKPSTTKKPSAPGTAAAAKPSSPTDAVVGITSKKKFHRPDCRYARTAESGEEMTRATARKRGYSPCGICKP